MTVGSIYQGMLVLDKELEMNFIASLTSLQQARVQYIYYSRILK